MKKLLFVLLLLPVSVLSQCNQHVFTSVGAEKWTNFQYQDCDGGDHYFGLPAGGYTIIYCADIGTTFVLNGDGFVYPLLTEHPNYASCIQEDYFYQTTVYAKINISISFMGSNVIRTM